MKRNGNFDLLGDLHTFVKERSSLICKNQSKRLCRLEMAHLFIKSYYEFFLPNVYVTRSGCEIEHIEMCSYSDHDSARIIGSLITHHFNEAIVSLSVGNYYSALICLRSVIEWDLSLLAAITDVSLLTGDKAHQKKIMCIAGLTMLIEADRVNRQNRKAISSLRRDLSKRKFDADSKMLFSLRLATRQSFAKLIKGLDFRLLRYIHPESESSARDTLLSLYYGQLSGLVHFSEQELVALPTGA